MSCVTDITKAPRSSYGGVAPTRGRVDLRGPCPLMALRPGSSNMTNHPHTRVINDPSSELTLLAIMGCRLGDRGLARCMIEASEHAADEIADCGRDLSVDELVDRLAPESPDEIEGAARRRILRDQTLVRDELLPLIEVDDSDEAEDAGVPEVLRRMRALRGSFEGSLLDLPVRLETRA